MSSIVPVLAHIGSPNNPWIGVMTIAAAAMVVIFILAVAGAITVEAPGDLLLPLAVVVLLAGLAGTLGDAINDQGPWAVPAGLVLLISLIIMATRDDLDTSIKSPFVIGSVVLAIVAAVAVRPFLEELWFPSTEIFLPERGDATVELDLVSPPDETGTFTVLLSVTGGTLGATIVGVTGDDPEEQMVARWLVGPVYLNPAVSEACAASDACTETPVTMTLPAGFVDDAPDAITVELLTQTGLPFVEPLTASVLISGEG